MVTRCPNIQLNKNQWLTLSDPLELRLLVDATSYFVGAGKFSMAESNIDCIALTLLESRYRSCFNSSAALLDEDSLEG